MTKDEIIKENEELRLEYAKAINTISILERKLEKLKKENKRLRNENRKLKRKNKVLRRAMEIVEQMNKEELDFKRVIQLLKNVESMKGNLNFSRINRKEKKNS